MSTGIRMRGVLRRSALAALKACGAFRLVESSDWRRQRLMILCYHGISLDDEHEWEPALYIRPQQFERRLEILRQGKYSVLPLGEALERLYAHDLPPRSVAITFDDGTYDFYSRAYPRLQQYGFPSTVYLTTYYTDLQLPVFNVICSYILWKARNAGPVQLETFGVANPVALSSREARNEVLQQILKWADAQNSKAAEKNEIAARLAAQLCVSYEEIVRKRILQLMNADELQELATAGVDFQLHTHAHRTPLDEQLFRGEIQANRERIARIVPGPRRHFCYPSGVYRQEFLGWLRAEDVISATTCDTGLATADSEPLLLPRLVDTTGRNEVEFESWVNGIGHFLSLRKRAHPVAD